MQIKVIESKFPKKKKKYLNKILKYEENLFKEVSSAVIEWAEMCMLILILFIGLWLNFRV